MWRARIARIVAERRRGRRRSRMVHILGAPLAPTRTAHTAYARTKAAGEVAVRERFFPRAVVVRPKYRWMFGPGDAFFNRFAAMAVSSPALPLIGGGATRFQPVFVGDVAAAVGATLSDPSAQGQTYELGGPAVYSFEALMRLMLVVIERRAPLMRIGFGVARRLGQVGDLMARTGLISPLITSDQVELLRVDNVVTPGALGLADLGVSPTPVEAVIASYLYRYRKGGQYAEALHAPAVVS